MEQPSSLARPSLTENTADAPSLQGGDSVQMWGGGLIPRACAAWTFLQRYLDVALGLVLVVAGALKGHQLLTDASAGRASGFPRELLIGATAFELAFGCWLLAGLYRRMTRWLALAWFTSLAAVALAQAMGGAPTCACLGELHTNPWLIFAFDMAAVAALWMSGPIGSSSPRCLSLALFLSLLPAAGVISLAAVPRPESLFAEIDLGDIAQAIQKQQAFQFRNDSGTLMEISAIETSCPCASIRLERSGVPAGQFLAGTVTLDLRPKPEFTGNLVIEAKGLRSNGKVVFLLRIRAWVNPEPQAHTGVL